MDRPAGPGCCPYGSDRASAGPLLRAHPGRWLHLNSAKLWDNGKILFRKKLLSTMQPSLAGPHSQKYLGTKGLIVLIALLSAFVPLSTDLYLPALPGMSAYFHVPVERINLTLTAFFICYSLGTL